MKNEKKQLSTVASVILGLMIGAAFFVAMLLGFMIVDIATPEEARQEKLFGSGPVYHHSGIYSVPNSSYPEN